MLREDESGPTEKKKVKRVLTTSANVISYRDESQRTIFLSGAKLPRKILGFIDRIVRTGKYCEINKLHE